MSDLLREAINSLLGRDSGLALGPTVPQSLTPVQRRTLALQHEILAELHNEPEDGYDLTSRLPYHRERVEVLYRGYTGEYGDEFNLDPELARSECRLVWDVLDMFRILRASLERVSDEQRSTLDDVSHQLEFRGFDGNDDREGAMLFYARHLLRTGRWTDLAAQFESNDGGNSHWPALGKYQRMLQAYAPRWERVTSHPGWNELLSVEDLRAIAEA